MFILDTGGSLTIGGKGQWKLNDVIEEAPELLEKWIEEAVVSLWASRFRLARLEGSGPLTPEPADKTYTISVKVKVHLEEATLEESAVREAAP